MNSATAHSIAVTTPVLKSQEHLVAELYAAEDRHFWFRARNLLIEAIVRQIVPNLTNGYRLLEVGCGVARAIPK
jgi:hypothetical protein